MGSGVRRFMGTPPGANPSSGFSEMRQPRRGDTRVAQTIDLLRSAQSFSL